MNAFAECLLEMNGNEESPAGQRLVRSSRIDISSSCFDFQQALCNGFGILQGRSALTCYHSWPVRRRAWCLRQGS